MRNHDHKGANVLPVLKSPAYIFDCVEHPRVRCHIAHQHGCARDLLREATTGLLNAASPTISYPIADWEVVVDASNELAAGGQAIADEAAVLADYNAQACTG